MPMPAARPIPIAASLRSTSAVLGLAAIVLAAGLSGAGTAAAQPLPLPDGVAAMLGSGGDLRGEFRAALCGRDDIDAATCARTLRTFANEVPAARPPAARAASYRLLFVPGFLAACFPGVHSFADVIETARAAGFAAETLAVGGRNGIAANARMLEDQVARLPADGRRLVFVAHSKGAADVLAMLAARPDLRARTDAVLTVSGAMNGTPLADTFRGLYDATLAVLPLPGCDRGEGDPVGDLTPAVRRAWWQDPHARHEVPVYSIVAMPDLAHVSPGVLPTYLRLARTQGGNDGMLLLRDQVAPGGALLGVVDADHLRVAIPFPGPGFVMLFNADPFPRAAMVLAAVDVIAEQARTRQAPRAPPSTAASTAGQEVAAAAPVPRPADPSTASSMAGRPAGSDPSSRR